MNDQPKRRRFQFHLSTAIVLMFVAGGIIWENVRGEKVSLGIRAGYARYTEHFVSNRYGWPFGFMTGEGHWTKEESPTILQLDLILDTSILNRSLVLNVLVALAILFAVYFVCESWIRWRTSRKMMSKGKA